MAAPHASAAAGGVDPAAPPFRTLRAYQLLIPLGLLGAHYAYLGRWRWALLYACTLGLAGFGFLADVFLLPDLVKRANYDAQRHFTGSAPPPPRSLSDARKLWLPLGLLGLHHFYLGRRGWGLLYLCTGGVLGVGWLIDAFDLPRLVDEANGAAASAEAGAEGTITQPFHVRDAVKLCFPLGFLGLHHFWLRRPAWGFAFLFSAGLFFIGWLLDAFQLSGLVWEANMSYRVIEPQRSEPSVIAEEGEA